MNNSTNSINSMNNSNNSSNSSLIDVGEEMLVIGTWPTRFAALVAVLVNFFLIVIFLDSSRSREGCQLKHRAKLLALAISDLLFSLYFAAVCVWTLFVTDSTGFSHWIYLVLQFYAVFVLVINRLLSLEIAVHRAWIMVGGLKQHGRFLHQTTKDVVKEIVKRAVVPGILIGIVICGIVYNGFRKIERGIPPPKWYFLFQAIALTGLGVTMATVAAFILIKSRVTFQGQQMLIEFQHAVAAVAIVFCLCGIPCSVVYWWRALLLLRGRPLTDVPILARQAQAFFHLVNSGSNFFIYLGISDKFRQDSLHLWHLMLQKRASETAI